MTKQVRFIPIENCGLRVREDGEGQSGSRRVVGKPIVFGVRSVNLTPWSNTRVVYEVLEPDCISDELLKRSDVLLNLNHSNQVQHILGRYRNGKGTLSLAKREDCMEAECDLPETTAANDTLVLIKRGDITGMSFAFNDDWEDTENGVSYERTTETVDGKEVWLRHVKRITGLYDVSIVTTPAYEQTSVGTREAGDEILSRIEEQIAAQQREDKAEDSEEETDTTEDGGQDTEADTDTTEDDGEEKKAEDTAAAEEEEERERAAAAEREQVAERNRRRSRRNKAEEMFDSLIF